MEQEEESSCGVEEDSLNLWDLPDLVTTKILELLPFQDLKSLREVSPFGKDLVDNYSNFYDQLVFVVTSHNFLEVMETREERDSRFLKTLRFSLDFKYVDIRADFLQNCSETTETLQLMNYPFRTIQLDFLSYFSRLHTLEFLGTWALANFAGFTPPQSLTNIKHLNVRLCSDASLSQHFQAFGTFLNHFQNLRTLRIHCWANHQLLFKEVLHYSFQHLVKTRSNPNVDLDNFPTARSLCEFCYEMEFDYSLPKNEDMDDIEQQLFSAITGISTQTIGHNVTFPFHKLKNLTWLTLHLSKFNYPESFAGNPFLKLRKLHLTLHQDFQLVELRKAQEIFGFDGNIVKEIVLQLPIEKNIRAAAKEELVSNFFSAFKSIKILEVHNWYSLLWQLPPALRKLKLVSVVQKD